MLIERDAEIQILLGAINIQPRPERPFNDIALGFVDSFSRSISREQKQLYPDLAALAFWTRRKHIEQIRDGSSCLNNQVGLGLVLHITPSNVPLNFMYSYLVGLLTGNANVVKLPSKPSPQETIVLEILNRLLANSDFQDIATQTLFLRYPRFHTLTEQLSKQCNARIIWGGNDTVTAVRALATAPRTVDIAFADRYSIALLSGNHVLSLDESELLKLCIRFYNDTYQMDQNACSSPHFVGWIDDQSNAAKTRFWTTLKRYLKDHYPLSESQAVTKYTRLLTYLAKHSIPTPTDTEDNRLYRVKVDQFSPALISERGNSGLFFEADIYLINDLIKDLSSQIQTVTYFGIDPNVLCNRIIDTNCLGVDRIVPIGQALDFEFTWDGINLIERLTRYISTR